MEISLYILWNNEEDNDLLNAGLDPKTELDDCPLVEHTFYHIDFIRPHVTDTRYSVICTNGEEYLTKVDYELLKLEISLQKRMSFLN